MLNELLKGKDFESLTIPFQAVAVDIGRVKQIDSGVEAASLVSDIPLGGSASAVFYMAEGDTTTDAQTRPRAYVHRVTPEFFETMGMPVTHGRTFEASEVVSGNRYA